ncbi:glycosyltransferase family 4 protein [candidate division KSB1 bacterium]|nr:glycosyltransferase family 4 protein [candidate division KSB1 bacterium]
MKICIDARKITDLGIGTYLQNILNQFCKIGTTHRFLLLFAPEMIEEFRQKYPSPKFQLEIEEAPKYSIAELFTISNKIRRFKADIYHAPHYTVPLFKIRPTIAIIHDLIHLKFPEYLTSSFARYYAKWMMKHAISTSDHIITISEWSKKDIIEFFKIPAEKITVVYGAVADSFRKLDDFFVKEFLYNQLKIDKPYLFYCGAFKPHKNLITLLKAFQKVDSVLCPYLVLGGDDLESNPELKMQVALLDLNGRLITPGRLSIENLVQLYNGAVGFVFPSEYEGFGLPPLEAMQCGVPVISSNASCLPEVLGDAALYFEPKSAEQLTLQMNRLLTDTDLRQNLIQKGFNQVKKYSWQKSAQQILDIYQKFEI